MADTFDQGRLEAFSDGVFAIAITLLVLELAVPVSAFDDLWRGIVHQWPSYRAHATIGGLWAVHHGIFRRKRQAALLAPRVAAFGFLVIAIAAVLAPSRARRHGPWRRTG